jgi:hypothetical protein
MRRSWAGSKTIYETPPRGHESLARIATEATVCPGVTVESGATPHGRGRSRSQSTGVTSLRTHSPNPR